MSERGQYDGSNDPMDDMGELDDGTPRNRPATGAAFAQSPQELDLDWKGSSAATDFLGIEGDTQSDDVPAPIGSSLDTRGEVGLPADSWLHGIEGEDEGDFPDPAANSTTPAFAATGEDPRLEAIHDRTNARASSSKLFVIAAACVLLALLAGGGWYWKTHMRAPVAPDTAPVVAEKPPVAKPTPTNTKPTPPSVEPTTTPNTTVAVTEPAVEPTGTELTTDPELATGDPTEVPDTTPGFEPEVTFPDGVAPTVVLPDVAPEIPVSSEPVRVTSQPNATRVLPPSDTPIPGALRRATEEDFADLWRAPEIPTAEITGERKLLTLNVGRVRLMLQSGEYFEGDLYAVGQNRVWLNLDLGRISFEAPTVREMRRITSSSAKVALGKKKPEELAGLPHVEVRLAGGSVTGRLVGRDGDRITLVTDAGIRTILESSDVRPVTPRRTRVLGKVETLGGMPPPKPSPERP